MALYESTFIARQDMSKTDIAKLTDQLVGIIRDGGGKVVKNEYWGLRPLSYRIKKNRKGHYTMLGLDAPYEAVREMQRQISLNEEVLRNVTIRVETLDEEPSVMMNQRAGRDENEAGDDEPAIATTDTDNKEEA